MKNSKLPPAAKPARPKRPIGTSSPNTVLSARSEVRRISALPFAGKPAEPSRPIGGNRRPRAGLVLERKQKRNEDINVAVRGEASRAYEANRHMLAELSLERVRREDGEKGPSHPEDEEGDRDHEDQEGRDHAREDSDEGPGRKAEERDLGVAVRGEVHRAFSPSSVVSERVGNEDAGRA